MKTRKIWVKAMLDGEEKTKLFIKPIDPSIPLSRNIYNWLTELEYQQIEIIDYWQ